MIVEPVDPFEGGLFRGIETAPWPAPVDEWRRPCHICSDPQIGENSALLHLEMDGPPLGLIIPFAFLGHGQEPSRRAALFGHGHGDAHRRPVTRIDPRVIRNGEGQLQGGLGSATGLFLFKIAERGHKRGVAGGFAFAASRYGQDVERQGARPPEGFHVCEALHRQRRNRNGRRRRDGHRDLRHAPHCLHGFSQRPERIHAV